MKRLTAVLLTVCSTAVGAQATQPQGTAAPPPATKVGAMPSKTAIEKTLMDNEQKINDAVMKGEDRKSVV